MDEQVICPSCSTGLALRQLRSKTVTVESCPKCGAQVRVADSFRFENVELRIMGDIDSIVQWLEAERNALNFELEQDRNEESKGIFCWRLSGCLPEKEIAGWTVEVVHNTQKPNILEVKLTVVEQQILREETLSLWTTIFKDHALQPHGSTRSSSDIWGKAVSETKWGPLQYLSTMWLRQGLLRPVLNRLVAAVKDAETTRQRIANKTT